MRNNQIRVSASIVLYNTPEAMLFRLLACIKNSSVVDIVYLIDNSPAPLQYNFFDQPTINYKWSGVNAGYGGGHNIALKKVIEQASDFHFVLNPDIYFEPQELQKMIVRMNDDPSIGQLMPKVIYPDGSLQYLCKLIPRPIDLFLRRFLQGPFKELAKRKAEEFELRFTGYNDEMDVPYLSGCFMLFRISAIKK